MEAFCCTEAKTGILICILKTAKQIFIIIQNCMRTVEHDKEPPNGFAELQTMFVTFLSLCVSIGQDAQTQF